MVASASWTEDQEAVNLIIETLNSLLAFHLIVKDPLTVIFSNSPTAGDWTIARWIADRIPVEVTGEIYKPRFYTQSGSLVRKETVVARNQSMMGSPAHMVIAFRRHDSVDVGHLLTLARHKGIPAYEVTWPQPLPEPPPPEPGLHEYLKRLQDQKRNES